MVGGMRDIHISIGVVLGGIIVWVAGTLIVQWISRKSSTFPVRIQAERLQADQNANLTGACVISNYAYGASATTFPTRMVGRRTICTTTCRMIK